MVQQRETHEPPKTWEILGAFFAFFAVGKDVPTVFRTLELQKLIPSWIKSDLLLLNQSKDFWFLCAFTVSTVLLIVFILPRRKAIKAAKERDDFREEVAAKVRQWQIIRAVKSLGLVNLRECLLKSMKVTFYGTFLRPAEWGIAPNRKWRVDRISFADGRSLEYQYSSDFDSIFFREQSANEQRYGDEFQRKPNKDDIFPLIIASDYFFLWLLRFLLRSGLKRIVGFFAVQS